MTDDTRCLQAAIDAGVKERRHVHVPGGMYMVTRSLLIYGSNQSMLPYPAVTLDMTGDGKQESVIWAWAPGAYSAFPIPKGTASHWGNVTSSDTGNLGVIEYPTCCGPSPSRQCLRRWGRRVAGVGAPTGRRGRRLVDRSCPQLIFQ